MTKELAIGKLLDISGNRLLGTAFAVSSSHAFTAFHCIGRRVTGEVQQKKALLEFLTGDQIVGNYEAGSPVEDYAILSLQSPLPESLAPVLLLDQAYPNEPFRAAGYPSSVHQPDKPEKPDISFIGGLVRAENTSIFGGAPAIQLYSHEGAAGLSLHGVSGGPVLAGQAPEGAVGLVRWNDPQKDAPELGVGGSFWACPIKLIVEKHPEYADLVLHVRQPRPRDRFAGAAIAGYVNELIQTYTSQVFVGRDDKQDEIDEYIDQTNSGRLIITANAGFGKTALLANWINGPHKQDHFIVYHFFSQRHEGGRSITSAYRHLLSQLYVYFGFEGESIPGSEEELRDIIFGLLEQKVDEQKRLIIVLDALDEAERPFQFPLPSPHENIWLIASVRVEQDGTSPYLDETWTSEAKTIHLSQLPNPAIAVWLDEAKDGVLAPWSRKPEFIEQLAKKTEGFPLYLKYLIDDLIQIAQKGEDVAKYVDQVPQGFEEYVAEQLEKLDTLNLPDETWAFFALLTVSIGELRGEEIKSLIGIRDRNLRQLKQTREVMRWIQIRSDDLYSFSHPLLGDSFAAQLGDEADEALSRLLDWCQAYAERGWPDDTPDYVLQQYASHLNKEGDSERLFAMCNGALMKLHRSRYRKLEGFVNDLELVVTAAMRTQPVAWIPLIRTCYALASIHELSSAVPPKSLDIVARYGDIESAIDSAMFKPRGEQRAEILARIAQVLGERGQAKEARGLLSQAIDEFSAAQYGSNVSCNRALCQALEGAQDAEGLERLVELAEALPDPDSQTALLKPVLASLARVVSKERALIIIRHHLSDGLAFLNLAIALQPEFEDATLLDDVETLVPTDTTLEHSPFGVANVLANLAAARAKSGDALRAVATSEKALHAAEAGVKFIEEEWQKSHEVMPIALGRGWAELAGLLSHPFLADAARRAETHAWEGLDECDNEIELGFSASALAQLLINRDPGSLRRLFDKLDKHPVKLGYFGNDVILEEIAVGFARLGDAEGAKLAARELSHELSDHSTEAKLWPKIAHGLAEAKSYDEAREAIRISGKFGGEIDALDAVADVLSTQGMVDDALELAHRAIDLAESRMGGDLPFQVLASFAEELASFGSPGRAKQLAAKVVVFYEALPKGKRTNVDFASFMSALRVIDMHNVALNAASSFWSHNLACYYLSLIARESGNTVTAELAASKCLARAISNGHMGDSERLRCLISAAQALEPSDAGRARAFLSEVTKLTSLEDCRDRADLAIAYASLGDLDRARAILQWFFDEEPFAGVVAPPNREHPNRTGGADLETIDAHCWLSAACAFHAVELDSEAAALAWQTLRVIAERPIMLSHEKLASVIAILARRGQVDAIRSFRESLAAQHPSPARMIAEAAIISGLELADLIVASEELLADTIARSRHFARRYFFEAIKNVAHMFARWDNGETLWLLHQSLYEVNAWWGHPKEPSSDTAATLEQLATIDRQLSNDHVALMIARKHLSGEAGAVTATKCADAFRNASAEVKKQIFDEANGIRSRYWRENKDVMERTIPIFKTLIETDLDSAPHNYFGALGWAFHDQAEPDYAAAKANLDKAIDLLPEGVNQPYYQLVRALCNIQLDQNFSRGEVSAKSLREIILADLQHAERFLPSIIGDDPLISKWLNLNS